LNNDNESNYMSSVNMYGNAATGGAFSSVGAFQGAGTHSHLISPKQEFAPAGSSKHVI